METICSQSSQGALMGLSCFVYDFQTLLIGAAAIIVAIFAGIPVWRQLRDTNLQTRISHRETLVNLLRDVLRRYEKVDQSIREPLLVASRATSDPDGEAVEIGAEDANHFEQTLPGALDWYLVVLADTEHSDIETRKAALKTALVKLGDTLNDAHWADHNDQQQDNERISDDATSITLWRRLEAGAPTRMQPNETRSVPTTSWEAP
jgi:hypothetical protein